MRCPRISLASATTAGRASAYDLRPPHLPVTAFLRSRAALSFATIFRNRSGARYSVDTLGDDFRDVRTVEFGPLERRTIGHDFRRTGAVEAIVGGAKAEQVAHAMGNTLSALNALFETYVPVNVATLRDVLEARRTGRRKLR
jgi:hypothetical protein